jgi:DNA-binding transcriptional LysR family regulator
VQGRATSEIFGNPGRLLSPKSVMIAARKGLRDIEFLADPTVGEVRVPCPESLSASFVPAVIDRLLRKHPRVTVEVIGCSSSNAMCPRLRRACA